MKCGKDIHYALTGADFDCGCSVSLNMRVMGPFIELTSCSVPGLILVMGSHQMWCKCKAMHVTQHKSRVL